MSKPKNTASTKFDIALAGSIVAFDPETGDALYVHEKYVETMDGRPFCSADITEDECEQIREEAIQSYPRRRIDLITVRPEEVATTPPELGGGFSRYRVDPMTRKLRVEVRPDFHLLQEMWRMTCGPHFKGR